MSEETFGEGYAATYDGVYADKDYVAESDLLENLFGAHAQGRIKSILDLGCGTGRHAVELAARNYDVVGLDRSPGMLAQARSRAVERSLDVDFVSGDLREIRLEREFDAVLMMFAVLGYQLTDDDVDASLRTVRHHLTSGGLFVFDVWFGPAVVATGLERRERELVIEGKTWRRVSSGVQRTAAPLVDVDIRLESLSDESVVEETHTVRHFDRHDLGRHLHAAQLELVGLHPAGDPSREPDEETWNVIGVARAVSG